MSASARYFNPEMKMARLIETDHHLLTVLSRLGIRGGFGEGTVEKICTDNGLDPGTFSLLCNVYSFPSFEPEAEQLRRGRINDVLRYLHQSHDYYVNNAIVTLASNLETLIEPCKDNLRQIIWKFFSDYKTELEKHFEYEEGNVIPYVQNLMIGRARPGFSIDSFEEDDTSIDESLSDLRSLVLKSLPAECNDTLRTKLLNFIFNLQRDLARHSLVEDKLMIPMVRLIEDPHSAYGRTDSTTEESRERADELSEREKEILVSVARGMLNKEIADKLDISINTVITHRKNITRKTGIRTVAGLTVYAILNNLIDINSVK